MNSPSSAPGPSYLVAGRYRLIHRIGRGGMGAVWLAHDQLLDREVAVKQVLTTSGMDESTAETSRARALREGRLAARLSHRNAVSMHDVALDRDEPWLVMEYVPSHSVADVLKENETIDPVEAAQICAQVADAIADAHASGIIHRDIKPANILITNSGRSVGLVKITDFGISRAKDDVSITQTGIVTGTPAFFAPEVARGEEPGEPSDVFSLGSTLYTMVEGRPPFGDEDNYIATMHRVALAQINPITRAGALSPILLQLLEPTPTSRPTMAQARDLLAQFAAGTLGTTDNVLTGLVPTRLLTGRPTPSTQHPSHPSAPHAAAPDLASHSPTAHATPAPRQPTRVANGSSSYYAPPSTPEPIPAEPSYQPQNHRQQYYSQPNAYYPPQQQESSNAGLAAAIFAGFVLLTAIVAVFIVLLS